MTSDALGHATSHVALLGAPVAVMILGLDGELLEVNDTLAELLARPREDLVGRYLPYLARSPEDTESARQAIEQAAGGTPCGALTQVWPSGDGTVHVRLAWTLHRDAAGEPTCLTVICLDETRRVLAERRVALSEARFEQSTIPQTTLDLTGRLVDANQAFCQLVDRSLDRLVGRHVRELGDRAEGRKTAALVSRLLAGTVDQVQVERMIRGTNGRPVQVLAHASALKDASGQRIGAVAYLHDLTALRDVEQRRQQQEDFFLALSQRASDLVIVLDALGQVLYTSPALTGGLGHEPIDVLSEDVLDFIHPDDRATTTTLLDDVVRGAEASTTLRIRDSAGGWRWFEATMGNLLDTVVGGVVCNLRDVTERITAERALRASEARYRAIADSADEGLWVASADGRTLYVNTRLCDILGLDADEVYAKEVGELVAGGPGTSGHQPGLAGRVGAERYETTYAHPDGRIRVLRIAAAPLEVGEGEDDQAAYLAMVTDITESRRLERELRQAALHDHLTGLPNRALLLDRLEHALTREIRSTAVLFVDLDQFKIINDARGHTVGDQLLVAVADRLRASVRPFDTVARFGGDEFLVICENVDEEHSHLIATELLLALDEPFPVASGVLDVAATIGIALSPSPSAEHLLRNAETAMYAAKQAGRRGIRVFDTSLAEQAQELYELGADLRAALRADELVMHYQPIVELAGGAVVGVEALARWNHPTLGAVPPDRFVALAERTGISRELDRWAIARALRETGRLRDQGALPPSAYVAVNLSPRHLADTGLEEHLDACTRAAGLSPAHVTLEITERAIMAEPEPAIALLRRLRAQGYRVAMDDFGTGHSSLSHLHALPVSTLKIDRSFVADICGDHNARAITTSIVDLARAVGVTVVAEGVETLEQRLLLEELGCTTGQGWLWSAAISPEQAVATRAFVQPFGAGPTAQLAIG
jgi:diguanylate cyclase (GGDEF)-like protein/PAS domain S-box-containing protein